jgi:tetratricopeptide (TPR) repeat protein
VLGPVEILDGNGRPLPLGRVKQRVLLTMLALRAGVAVPRETLIAGLWGQSPPRSAAANLSTYVSELRKLVPVVVSDGGYRLDLTDVDVLDFRGLAARGRVAREDGRAELAADLLTQARELWRGPVFTGLPVPGSMAGDLADLDALRAEVDAAAAPAPAAGPASPPRQLPAAARAFTGRDAELAWLDAALARQVRSGALMLTAVVGSAGTGKTALAVRWAHTAAGHFPDGQLHADLRGHGAGTPAAPLEVLTSFLRALGLREEQIPADEPSAAAALRSALAGTRTLVLLDNAGSAEQVRPLLPGGPGCLVLVTSRGRLTDLVAVDGADLLPIGGLDPRDSRRLLSAVLGEERVLAEPEAATALGELCAHLPLALRLAAARVTTSGGSLAAYVAELAEARLDLLSVDERPSTVRAMFDASYRLLADDVRRLFRLLSFAPGPTFTARSAAALLDVAPETAAGLVGGLVAASMVERRGPDRYGMHDLLAVYAGEKAALEEPAAHEERGRLLRCHLADAATAVDRLGWAMAREPVAVDGGPPALRLTGHAEALAWLDDNLDALARAAADAAEHGPRPIAWQLADQLRGYFWLRRCTPEWLAVATAAVSAATAERDPAGVIAARHCLGDAHWSLGQYEEATAQYTPAIAACRAAGSPERHSGLLINIGAVCREQGELDAAAAHLREALGIKRRNGLAESTVRANLGVTYQEMGRFDDALAEHTRVLELNSATGVTADRAFSLIALGATHRALGRVDLAIGHLTDALALHRETGNRAGEVNALEELAAAERDRGDLPAALACASAAAELARELGNPRAEVATTLALASVQLRLGDHWEAVRGYERGLAAARRDRIRYAEVEALIGLAGAHRADAPDTAAQLAAEALEAATACGFGHLAELAREQAGR